MLRFTPTMVLLKLFDEVSVRVATNGLQPHKSPSEKGDIFSTPDGAKWLQPHKDPSETPMPTPRTWATLLASADVDPMVAIEWGGWNDLQTFLDHYQGKYSPETRKRERG